MWTPTHQVYDQFVKGYSFRFFLCKKKNSSNPKFRFRKIKTHDMKTITVYLQKKEILYSSVFSSCVQKICRVQ